MPVSRLHKVSEPVSPWTLRIELLDVKPVVWRRLVVPADILLPALHEVFQVALGWKNSHLHEFRIDGVRFAAPDPHAIDRAPMVDERRILLAEAMRRHARVFDYMYDFGDHWQHAVVLEEIYTRPVPRVAARCLAGENACPPEDIGGPPGYDDFRAALVDPQHEAHEDFVALYGEGFEPALFDLDATNRALEKLRV